ncbi:MAG: O-antigen ligase family protein [Candidatus Delongbacteria bacterium]|nr:O-antigen ligase family protein [Candidatus Delongbacteria bacterium]
MNMRATYFYVFLAGLAILPLFFSRLSVHLFSILLFLDVILLGVFNRGTFTFVGLRVGFFDIFILSSTFILFFRFRTRISFQMLLPFSVYLLLFSLSVLFKPEIMESGTFYWQLFAVENLLILILAMMVIDSKREARLLLGSVTVLMSLVVLYFFYRYWQHGQISFGGIAEDRETTVLAFPEGSAYGNKNAMAGQILPVMMMLMVFAFELKSKTLRLVSGLVATLAFLVILASASRGAAIAGIGSTAFYLGLRFRSGRLSIIPLILVSLVAVTLALESDMGQRLLDRVLIRGDKQEAALTDYNRLSLIKTSAALIKRHPLLGIGFDEQNFMLENEKYNFSDKVWAHPHNSYLHLWVFGGTLTFIGLIWVVSRLASPTWKLLRKRLNDPLLLAVATALIALLLDFGTDRTFFVGPISHLFFMLLAGSCIYSGYLLREYEEQE